MAKREELILDVEVKGARDVDKVAESFEDVEDAAKKAGKAGEAAAKALVADWDAVGAQAKETATIMRTLGDALGTDASKFDLQKIAENLQKTGLDAKQAAENIDLITDGLRRLDSAKASADDLAGGLGRVRDKGDQSRSVLANLAGNATQDLGQLGGVVGSLGVGIGQLAEYAVDGNIQLSNLAQVAGPMLGLSAALFAVQYEMAAIAKQKAFDKGEVDAYAAAIDEVGLGVDAVAQHLNEVKKFEFAADSGFGGFGTAIKDVTGLLENYGITADEISHVIAGTDEQQKAWRDSLLASNGNLSEQSQIINAVRQATENYRSAVKRTSDVQEVFAGTLGTANVALTGVLDQLDPMRSFGEQWTQIMSDIADGHVDMEASVQAISDIGSGLGLTEEQIISIAKTNLDEKAAADAEALAAEAEAAQAAAEAIREFGIETGTVASRAEGISDAFERLNAASQLQATSEVIDFADAMHGLAGSIDELADSDLEGINLGEIDIIPDTWDEVLNMPEELSGVVDAIGGMRDQIQSEMGQAFERGGSPEALQWADNTRQAITESLRAAGINSQEVINQILTELGILDDTQVEATIALAHEEQVLNALATITSGIEGIPADKAFDIQMAINDSDPQTAVGLINDYLISIGEEPVNVDIVASDNGTVQQFSDDADAAAEERNPQFVVPKSDSLGQMEELLNAVARQRIVDFNAKSDNAGAVDGILNHVARDRTAWIIVDLLMIQQAERSLNLVARDRTSTIHVNTVGGGGGGGGAATPNAAPNAATMAVGPTPLAGPSTSSISAVTQTPFVPAVQPINVTINAGVLGNHFDVERTVARALRRHQRVNGRR